MSVLSNVGEHVQEYIWDFDVDGGASAVSIDLSAKNNKSVIPTDAVITGVYARVITAVVGAGGTMVWGNTTDPNGYSNDIPVADLSVDAIVTGATHASALLWDDSNDHDIPFCVNSDNDADFLVNFTTGVDITAGKIAFYVKYIQGSIVS